MKYVRTLREDVTKGLIWSSLAAKYFAAAAAAYCTSITKSVSVQVYTKPVNCASVQNVYKLLLYKCTQNQFTVQVYTKPVYCTSVHKTSLLVNNERNVQGQNIKECTWTEQYQG